MPLYGVNLGGWLVLEKWMTPSLFENTDADDEYNFMFTPDAIEKIEQHRRSFITESDFRWLSKNGITAIRIPVGYWLFEDNAPYTSTIKYLDWAIAIAKKYSLKVLVDLHAARGSQNGQDHSGKKGKAEWYRNATNRQQTLEVLEKIATYYKDESTVWGIELLNEPRSGLIQWKLRRFYKEAYSRIVSVGRKGLVVVFHDAFTPRLLSGSIRSRDDFPVMIDIHWYHFLDFFHRWRSPKSYMRRIMNRKKILRSLASRQSVVIGEWSGVISHEAMLRYPKFSTKDFTKQAISAQLDVYEQTEGWFYWSYKTESAGIWNFRSLVENGTISLK